MICEALRNIPKKKLEILIAKIEADVEDHARQQVLKKAFIRYFDSNIPYLYWKISMNDFKGDENLKIFYDNFINDFQKNYDRGKIVCLAGSFGRGKSTVATNIIKRAVEGGYSGLYVTLSDIVSIVQSDSKFEARKDLMTVDFLVIDEFDTRHISNTQAAYEFFARSTEDIFRSRIQNSLPLILCTNSPNPLESFTGALKESLSSLWHHVEMIPVLGKDFRKEIIINE